MSYITGNEMNDKALMNYKYYCVIKIKTSVELESIGELLEMADRAFSNTAGEIRNISEYPHRLIYCSNLDDLKCLELGMSILTRNNYFLSSVRSLQWINTEDSANNEDRLETLQKCIET